MINELIRAILLVNFEELVMFPLVELMPKGKPTTSEQCDISYLEGIWISEVDSPKLTLPVSVVCS